MIKLRELYILILFLINSIPTGAKVTIEESLINKGMKRKIGQFTYLQTAQSRFESFIKCSQSMPEKDGDLNQFAKCVNENFIRMQSPVTLVTFLRWFQSNSKVSPLYDCSPETLKIANQLKRNPKDVIYCFDVLDNGAKASGFIFFEVKDEKLKIQRIKI